MQDAILTKAGAKRISRPELAGQIVQYDKVNRFQCAENVYYNGERLCGTLSMTEKEDTGLKPA